MKYIFYLSPDELKEAVQKEKEKQVADKSSKKDQTDFDYYSKRWEETQAEKKTAKQEDSLVIDIPPVPEIPTTPEDEQVTSSAKSISDKSTNSSSDNRQRVQRKNNGAAKKKNASAARHVVVGIILYTLGMFLLTQIGTLMPSTSAAFKHFAFFPFYIRPVWLCILLIIIEIISFYYIIFFTDFITSKEYNLSQQRIIMRVKQVVTCFLISNILLQVFCFVAKKAGYIAIYNILKTALFYISFIYPYNVPFILENHYVWALVLLFAIELLCLIFMITTIKKCKKQLRQK